jgi:hypothetical protein
MLHLIFMKHLVLLQNLESIMDQQLALEIVRPAQRLYMFFFRPVEIRPEAVCADRID